jgi:hypothetical protein
VPIGVGVGVGVEVEAVVEVIVEWMLVTMFSKERNRRIFCFILN